MDDWLARALVASAHDAIVTQTLDGVVTSWNAAAERLYGYAEDEIVGHRFATLAPDGEGRDDAHALRFVTLRKRKDGALIRLAVTRSPIHDREGRIIGTSEIAHDVTEPMVERERLERLQRLTAALLGGRTSDEIAVLTMRFAAEAVGASVATFSVVAEDGMVQTDHALGMSLDEIKHFRRLPLSADVGACIAIRQAKPFAVTAEGQHRRLFPSPEWIVPHQGGARISLPVIWEGRAIASINLGFPTWRGFSAAELAYMETIAGQCAQALQRARAYVAEHAARALAERNVDLRERMLAVVSHDLRSPLGTIVTIAAMVARAADHEVPRDVLAKWAGGLDRSAKQMTRLINDLLDLAMIDGGSFRIVRGDHALDEIVEDALATFRPVALERGIRLSASVPRNQVVDCDAARTVQVLGNLLSNALSVTPRGGEVRVECTVTLDHVRIEVRDTGPGIAPDDLPRLFDRYWRAASPHYRGAGLGLAIAKGIVEAQDGRISVTSVVGVGTAFAFTVSRER